MILQTYSELHPEMQKWIFIIFSVVCAVVGVSMIHTLKIKTNISVITPEIIYFLVCFSSYGVQFCLFFLFLLIFLCSL